MKEEAAVPVLGPPPPTLRELEVFLAYVEHATATAAGPALGITPGTVKETMRGLYAKIGARSKMHAALILWPVLGEHYKVPGPSIDRRLGMERRRG